MIRPHFSTTSPKLRPLLAIGMLILLPILLCAFGLSLERTLTFVTLLAFLAALHSSGRNARQAQERYAELQISQERFQAARDGSQDAFFLLQSLRDANGRIEDFSFVDINTRAEAMLMRSRPDVIGQRLCDLLPVNRTQGFVNKYIHVVETGEPLEEEFELQVEGIGAAWIQHQVVRAGDGIAIVSRDISREKAIECQLIEQQVELLQVNEWMERHIALINEQNVELEMQKLELEEANERLAALATTDGLTGLKNHRTFQEKLVEECERAQRYDKPLSLLLIDVDHFKSYNDEFGHPAGDHILIEVAGILQGASRSTDFIARYGGEEFVIILPYTDAEGAMGCGERLRAAISSHAWEQRSITVSIGAATFHAATQSPAALIAEADQALYISKSTGRDRATHGGAAAPLSRV